MYLEFWWKKKRLTFFVCIHDCTKLLNLRIPKVIILLLLPYKFNKVVWSIAVSVDSDQTKSTLI